MNSIDLLCPCSSTENSDELNVEQDTTLIESINTKLKEVSNTIIESNTNITNALNNLNNTTKKETETESETESEEQ